MTEQTGVASVGAAVRSARNASGLSLRALAAALELSPATMSAIENDRTPLTVERLQRIADAVDVPVERLVRGEMTRPAAAAGAVRPPVETGEWRRYDDSPLNPILEAATRLFVRQGFHATSMREVAAEAGVSVAGIYHHYPAKELILVALMDVTMSEIRWRLFAARDEATGSREEFAAMVESLALFHAVRRDLAFLGASEMRGISGDELVRVTGLRDEVQHLLDEQAALAFPGIEVRTPCRAIATMCTSLPSWFREEGPLAAQEVAKQYATFALAILDRS
ncbi:AcrR family transcriptional regulator/DNA-binding XRE family transcriptional regulator [Nocardioides daedukensis]|uniref:AcrR family transcriptional regulator/DNA-binding XRE family transcriptional regulator n=1 Tax=Nocardioides daedukensis TaxID=634462 RepID=A0A7Y9UQY7_9ACTN|nr:TetR/AcrR family transcriptional regulator [Nocardioides daedukensis]NYG59772.1 AcrR family transcriptional regulator/DNA-binding XRE family transcriptional regulator [Nocardioides daedukensis]